MTEHRGRKRRFNPDIPAHIDQKKLPRRCYWDRKGKFWYTLYTDHQGKTKYEKLADRNARMSDLYLRIEELNGIDRATFAWIADEYFKSDRFKRLTARTKSDYVYCHDVICSYQTRLKKPLSQIPLSYWTPPFVQQLVDKLTSTRGPSAAKHIRGFVRLVFAWAKIRGHVKENPALGMDMPKERKRQRVPTHRAYGRLLRLAKINGTYGQKSSGSCPHYIWPVMVIEYQCRLRGVECRNLTDYDLTEDGLRVDRRKGSSTNITRWNDELRQAIDYLMTAREAIWSRKKRPHPMDPRKRPLIVNTMGERLNRQAYSSAWQRFIRGALEDGVITPEERFSLHDLKRKGITDTPGTQADKMDASGHKDPRMMDVYDKSIKTVDPTSGKKENR